MRKMWVDRQAHYRLRDQMVKMYVHTGSELFYPTLKRTCGSTQFVVSRKLTSTDDGGSRWQRLFLRSRRKPEELKRPFNIGIPRRRGMATRHQNSLG